MHGANRHTKNNNTRNNGKFAAAAAARERAEASATETRAKIPLIRQAENHSTIPKYTNILSRTSEDGVTMEDLDSLQQDFEKLLSCCALRNRFLRAELENVDKADERRDRKGKPIAQASLKRKRTDDKPSKQKDFKNGTRIIKKQYGITNNFVGEPPRQEIPKVTLPKNDTSDKFWSSVEPYCADVDKDDVAFLDSLINECSKEIELKIPDIGEHYTAEWTDDLITDDKTKSPKAKMPPEFKKVIETIRDRVISAQSNEKYQNGELESILKSLPTQKMGMCMERRLRKELLENGTSNKGNDDEILTEIKKCHQELITVNEYNVEELKKLKSVVVKDFKRQEVRQALKKVDTEILEMYNKIIQAKQKVLQTDDELDKSVINKQIIEDFETAADALINKQNALNKELSELVANEKLY